MPYLLATTENLVRWYIIKVRGQEIALVEVLDLGTVPHYPDKESAKLAAQSAGLKTWRYVRI